MFLADELILDAPRRTKEGYMAVRAKAARAGVYDYRGREVDPEGKHFAADAVVKVYRPEDEVFAKDAVRSFLLKPITDDHPAQAVTADNWKQHAKGVNAGAMRDGEYLAFDLVLMDAATIDGVESGKNELSNGYQCEIEVGDGTAPDGTAYQATQRAIRGNHVAVVKKGRAGPECRIGDVAICDAITLADLLADQRTYQPQDDAANLPPTRRDDVSSLDGGRMTTKLITFDGLPVEVTDAAEAVIRKLEGQLADAITARTAAETQVATLTTDKATLDAKVITLEKQIEDAKLTPAQLRDAAKVYQAIADKAKALDVAITDEMDEGAIMKATVTAKVGDAAKDWTDVQIAASFATLTKDVKPADPIDPVRAAIRDGARPETPESKVHEAYDAMVTDMTDAWKPKKAA